MLNSRPLEGTAPAGIYRHVLRGAVIAGLASYVSVRWLTLLQDPDRDLFAFCSLVAGIICVVRVRLIDRARLRPGRRTVGSRSETRVTPTAQLPDGY